jgi:glycosyltransferase involved in cell wall biosynthesis
MARVAVVTSHPPFARGGHLLIARSLCEALREQGHDADLLTTPQNRFGRQTSAYLANRLTDVEVGHDGEPIDQVISLRYPSYAVRHPVHVCWLNHRMREYYDLWERFEASLPRRARVKERIRRRLIQAVDRRLLTRNVTHLFAQSRTIQQRLERWGNIRSTLLYPPAPPRPYRCDGYGDFFFAASRLTALKRLDLLVRALAEPDGVGLRCVIAGEGEEADALVRLARSLRVGDRIEFLGRVDEATLVARLATCRAVCFPTRQEDYGFVTAEAFASRKAVVTCRDSGGPAELVEDGVSGFVCDPAPSEIATALRRLADASDLAARLGEAGHAATSEWSWSAVVRRLVVV